MHLLPRRRPVVPSFRPLVALLLVVALVAAAGCGARPAVVATVEPVNAKPRPTGLAILRFDDKREIRDLNPSIQNIPILIWWASTRKSQFDRANRSLFGDFFSGILAERLKNEIEKQNAFRSVAVVSSIEAARDYPLLVRGRIVEGAREGTITPWGAGFLAKYLWLLAIFPKGTHQWTFEVQYEVVPTLSVMPDVATEGAPSGPLLRPFTLKNESRRRWTTAYTDTSNVSEVFEAIDNLSAAAAAQILNGLPPAGSPQLAAVVAGHTEWQRRQELARQVTERLSPPTVSLATIPPGETIREGVITLDWGITAVGGIRTATLTHNGNRVEVTALQTELDKSDKNSAPRSFSRREQILLSLGRNTMKLQMTDWFDQSADGELSVTRLPRQLYKEPRTAVVVGVSRYGRGALAGMDNPGARNAEAMERFLTDPYGGQMRRSDVMALLDGDATLAAVTEALRDAVARTRQGDTVLLYFSGLSLAIDRAGPAYLLFADTDLDNLGPTAMSVEQLRALLEESQADNLILVVDAAYPVGDYELHAQGPLVDTARRLRNVGVLVSTDRADVRTLARGKTFTDMMLEVMSPASDRDNDGVLTIDDVFQSLGQASAAEGLPYPRLTGRYEPTLPLKMLE